MNSTKTVVVLTVLILAGIGALGYFSYRTYEQTKTQD